jgi:hypothetical protein
MTFKPRDRVVFMTAEPSLETFAMKPATVRVADGHTTIIDLDDGRAICTYQGELVALAEYLTVPYGAKPTSPAWETIGRFQYALDPNADRFDPADVGPVRRLGCIRYPQTEDEGSMV